MITRSLRFALATWRRLRPVHAVTAVLLGLGAFAVTSAPYVHGSPGSSGPIERFGASLVAHQILAWCLVLAVMIADRGGRHAGGRRAAYVAAIVAGVACGVTLDWLLQRFAWGTFATPSDPNEPGISMFTWPLWRAMEWLTFGGFAVFLHAQRRQAREVVARLRVAELNRLGKSRQMIEARIALMHARVDPKYLFETLARVQSLHRDASPGSAARASRILDDLIDHLRAAMPRMRDAASTEPIVRFGS